MSRTLILDNGSHTIKAGYFGEENPRIIPNYVFKGSTESYIGAEINECSDPVGLYLNSPFDRGYLVRMDVQNEIWRQLFGPEQCDVNFGDTKIVMTDANMAVPTIDMGAREILFEAYGFHSMILTSAPTLVGRQQYIKTRKPYGIVIDSGHSFTHIMPYILGKLSFEQALRVDVGGKIMTNVLRDKVSYSQVDLRSEFRLVNEIKEDLCYFATDFKSELRRLRELPRSKRVDYVLPDYSFLRRGKIKTESDGDQFKDFSKISLAAERIVVPETLFYPDLIGIDQIGLVDSVEKMCNGLFNYDIYGKHLLQNIVVVGGIAAMPSLKERLCLNLQSCFAVSDGPLMMEKCVHIPPDPMTEAWRAAAYLLQNDNDFVKKFVTRQEYQECGPNLCRTRFDDFAPQEWRDIDGDMVEWNFPQQK